MQELMTSQQNSTTLPIFTTVRGRAELIPANAAALALSSEVQEWDSAEQRGRLLTEVMGRISAAESRPYPFIWHASLTQKESPRDLIVCQWSVLPKLHPDDPEADEWVVTVSPWAGAALNRISQRIASDVGTHAFWAEYARSYDPVLSKMPFYQTAVSRHISSISEIAASSRVLDVGAGTGNVAIPLAGKGCQITLIDNCPEMLSKARQKADESNLLPQCQFHLLSATDLDQFEKESFDAANVLLVLFNVAEGQRALEAIVRCIRPGGQLVFTEPLRSFDERPLLELGNQIIKECDDIKMKSHWRVVRDAGHRLGQLIRTRSVNEVTAVDNTIRADDLPEALSKLGCNVTTNIDSHLGQCRHLVATTAETGR